MNFIFLQSCTKFNSSSRNFREVRESIVVANFSRCGPVNYCHKVEIKKQVWIRLNWSRKLLSMNQLIIYCKSRNKLSHQLVYSICQKFNSPKIYAIIIYINNIINNDILIFFSLSVRWERKKNLFRCAELIHLYFLSPF